MTHLVSAEHKAVGAKMDLRPCQTLPKQRQDFYDQLLNFFKASLYCRIYTVVKIRQKTLILQHCERSENLLFFNFGAKIQIFQKTE